MPMRMESIRLDKESPVPLHFQLRQQLLGQIRSGDLSVSECLPTEMVLIRTLEVSRSTVRQALDALVREGWLVREKGRGTFVRKPKIDEGFFQKLDSFSEEMRQKGLTPGTRVLAAGPSQGHPEVRLAFGLPEDAPLFQLTRLRLADGEPVVYLETWLPMNLLPGLETVDFETSSLYQVLESRYGMRVERAVRVIEAVAARTSEARLLDCKPGAPVCLVRSTAFLADGTPVEYSVARYRGDRNQFTVELLRK